MAQVVRSAAPTPPFDRTYEGLKPRLLNSLYELEKRLLTVPMRV